MEYLVTSPAQLGQLARGVRKCRRLTQAQMAARVGVRQKAVSLFETDPAHFTLERLFKMLTALEFELVLREKHPPSEASGQGDW